MDVSYLDPSVVAYPVSVGDQCWLHNFGAVQYDIEEAEYNNNDLKIMVNHTNFFLEKILHIE